MFSIIDKDFCTVTVQDQAKFKLSVLAVYLTSSLMNDRSSGTGKFTVDLQHRFIGTETYCRMILLILGKTYCKFLINILCISRTKCKFQIYTSSGYTIQFQIIFKCYIFIKLGV